MKPWPKPSAFNLPRDYEMARAEAAMERLRVAVEALRLIESRESSDFDSEAIATQTLAQIGELPKD
jgi:hypothetical protein